MKTPNLIRILLKNLQKNAKWFVFSSFLCAVIIGFVGCTNKPDNQVFDAIIIQSYLDIPGITEAEIAGIEALKGSRQSFSYGKIPSAEGFILPDGTFAGFSPMLCTLLTDLFGIPFKFEFHDWNSLLNGIDNGTIDFTSEYGITSERRNKYIMSDHIAHRSLSILTNSNRIVASPYDLNGLRVGIFLEGSAVAETITRAYPELSFEIIPIPNAVVEAEMLRNGLIDVIIGISAGMAYNYDDNKDFTLIHGLLPLAYIPVALTTVNNDLEPFISVINKYIASGGIYKLYELYREGNDNYIRNILYNSFSLEEREYIDNLSASVPVVLGNDTYPVSFYNINEGKYQGISIDVLAEITRMTGIKFEPVNDKDATWGDILEMLRTGEAALISDLIITEERKQYFIWPQTPFFSTPYAFFSKTEQRNLELYQIGHVTVGVVGWCATRQIYEKWFPDNKNVILYDSQDDALDALEQNEIDLFFNLGYILYYQQNYREKPGFKANFSFPVFNDTFFGLNKNENILCSIIDKTISYINIDKISNEWTSRSFDYSRLLAEEQSIHANQRALIVTVSAIFLILLMVIVFLLVSRNNKVKNMAIEAAHKTNELQLAKLNLIIEAANIGTVDMELDPDNPLSPNSRTEYSPGYKKLLGYTDDEKSPENLGDSRIGLVHPDDLESSFKVFSNHLFDKTGNSPFDIEQRLKKKNGEYAWFRTVGKAIRNKDGNPVRFVNAAFDMTETRNLINEAEKQRKDAEVASKSKSNFLSNMSHEMRTPLNAIIGMTTIGKKTNTIEQKNHALDKIEDASSHLLAVINDVLDMARIEANKLELASVEFNFERVLQKVLAVINFRVDEKQQKLILNIDNNIPRLLIGDDQRLAQVITNLLSNAVKFTPEGGEICLDAFLVNETDDNCELRIEIKDNGIGISPEKHDKLFSAFEQAESGTSRQYGGSGLGLAISKHIVEFMDGNIWVESELGKGAKFIFTVKVIRCKNESLGFHNDDIVNQNFNSGEFTGKYLLLAEDIEINREIIIALLEDTGISIECVENGEEALRLLEAFPDKYDIVFMDVQMPVMNGYEATRRIRALPERQRGRLPIIALTANVFKSDIEDCLAAGMDDHLGKPLDIDKVIEKLRIFLKG
ncbi:MAG: transporter substrate-binding domain-containing protein [Treponema sp.]|nr:transporter substrate-binding domain-containing protein [Treponema sp.]